MAEGRGFKFGLIFSVIIFVALYFLVYTKVANNPSAVLMIGKINISFLGKFLSNMKNLIITSLVVGFLLGIITGGSSRRNSYRQR